MSRDIAEWLAIGTAHPVDPANVGKGTATIRILPVDAGWALAGLPNHLCWLLRHKYMLDQTDFPSLMCEIIGHSLNEVFSWERMGDSLTVGEIRRIAAAAYDEFLSADHCPACNGRLCPACGGREETLCPTCCQECKGTGRKSYGSRKRAKLLKLGRARYMSRDVSKLYDMVTAMLSRWEGEGLWAVRQKLANRGNGGGS